MGEELWYRHAGAAMLRAATMPMQQTPDRWPLLSDPESCRAWLADAWTLPGFADATRYASAAFADRVEAVLDGHVTAVSHVRRVTVSVVRYLLRSVGRPTPFGLFAGVAPVRVGGGTEVGWGTSHRPVLRADTLWLDDVVERLEQDEALLPLLAVVISDLLVDRGGRIELARGPGRVTLRNTAVVRLVREAAATPIGFAALCETVVDRFPGVSRSTVRDALRGLVAQGVLITSLRAPMTVTDPLAYVIGALERATANPGPGPDTPVAQLRDIQQVIAVHNDRDTTAGERVRLRTAATMRMRRVSLAGRATLAGDLHLDCAVTVPASLAQEMAYAVTALVRLSRQSRPDPAWNEWCREFWDRYGTGALVPLADAVHPDAGIGWPAGFSGSVLTEPEDTVSRRDQELLRLAWTTVVGAQGELVLTDELIADITADAPADPRWIPPQVELAARVRAASPQALDRGEYTFTVHPAWAYGTLTGRFGPTVAASGLDATFAHTPSTVEGALPVQLSFVPLFPHAENVARVPAYLPQVLPLGEHRTNPDPRLIPVHDLGLVAVADGLHLVSMSRRRIVEPQVLHALALPKQAPPLARFLATLSRGFLARYTEFDWGAAAARLPYLPRVRYRRAILAPATWQVTATPGTDTHWEEGFERWRGRWGCPDMVELHDDHRSLRLDLTVDAHLCLLRQHLDRHGQARLTETVSAADTAWIGGHVHEIVMPFARATPPTPSLVRPAAAVVTNTTVAHRPAAPGVSWLYAQLFTHPERMDDLIREHLPRLLATLDDPPYWFARYRSIRETDHLRLRIRVHGPQQYAAIAPTVGAWAHRLCQSGAASGLTLATYHPEVGRYGGHAAIAAAEAVFAADSHAVTLALHLLPVSVVHPMALTAIGLVDIADAFHTDTDEATGWLVRHAATKPAAPADRQAADHAAAWAMRGTLPNGVGLPAPLAHAWQARRTALAAYRTALPDQVDTDEILSALLHMHHNRARRVDRSDEAGCRRLARQIALTRQARARARPA